MAKRDAPADYAAVTPRTEPQKAPATDMQPVQPRRRGWLKRQLSGTPPRDAVYALLGPWLLASLENGASLLVDGDVLFQAERWARAATLAHAALEEFGKCVVVISLATDLAVGGETDWSAYEHDLSDHTHKFSVANMITVLQRRSPDKRLSDLSEATETWAALAFRNSHRPFRERSLYVDVADGHIVTPHASITRDEAYGYMGAGFATLEALIDLASIFH